MLIIAGKKLCGRVDQVPGKCYVKTRFLHLYYVPLIPLSSWVIEQGTEKGEAFRGERITLSFKSILFGWLQTGLVIFGAFNLLRGAQLMLRHPHVANDGIDGELKLALGAMCLIAWIFFTFCPYRANARRAKELTSRLGLPFETNEESFYSDD